MDETTAIGRPRNPADPPPAEQPGVRGEPIDPARLVADHQQQVTRLVCRLLGGRDGVDDVVQEVFLSAIRGLDRFRGEARLSTWLARIAVNKSRSALRRRAIRRRFLRDAPSSSIDPAIAADHSDEIHEEVARAVARLPAKYREPIVLRYFEDVPIDEVAEVLGIARGTVDARLTRAREKLRTILNARLNS